MSEKVGHSLKILVVDDNEASAQTTAWALEMFGYQAVIAFKGATAIAEAKALKPDVVMMDIGLHDMDGYEVCKVLKQDPALSHTVFIAQTGWDLDEHRERSRAAGFRHHLVKPVNVMDLQSIMESLDFSVAR